MQIACAGGVGEAGGINLLHPLLLLLSIPEPQRRPGSKECATALGLWCREERGRNQRECGPAIMVVIMPAHNCREPSGAG